MSFFDKNQYVKIISKFVNKGQPTLGRVLIVSLIETSEYVSVYIPSKSTVVVLYTKEITLTDKEKDPELFI